MCGHVGVAGNIWKQEKEAFRLLLWFDWVRGPHSTGVGTVTRDNKIGYMKHVGSPEKLWEAFEGDGMSNGIVNENVKALIGHNRWATVGAKSGKNAHPFMHGNILGAHNGTLSSFRLSNFPKHKEFEVDSECIFDSLNTDGFEKTMDRICGAYALVWYDASTQKMNFIRNKERPLFVVWNSLGDALYWASEPWMLRTSLDRVGVKYEEIMEIETDKLYQLNLKTAVNTRNVNLEIVADHKGFEVPPYKAPFQGTTAKAQQTTVGTGSGNTTGASSTTGNLLGGTNYNDGKWAVGKIFDYKTQTWVWEKDNVITLPAPTKKKPDFKAHRAYNGKEIEFQLLGKLESKNSKTPYLAGQLLEGDDQIEVRVYALAHKDAQTWQTYDGYFNAKVKKAVSHKGETYLLVDLRTMEPREWATETEDDENEDATFLWYNDVKIDQDQWIERTKCGCINCTDKPRAMEQEFVLWINPTDFLCPDCRTSPEVVDNAIKKAS